MREVKVGIAYEGGNDGDVLLVWLKRLLMEKGIGIVGTPIKFSPGTGILGYISSYVKKFEREDVEIAIFCTDQDRDVDSRRRQIISKIEEISPTFANRAVVAVPCPHIERWLLLQDSVIKNILCLDGSKRLPYKDQSPKTCFISLYNESEYEKSQQQLRIEIAENMDLNYCARINSEFGHFLQDLRNVVNNISGDD